MKTGSELITEERQRQVDKEGWTPKHDAGHTTGDLALAGACYALAATAYTSEGAVWNWRTREAEDLWPWGSDTWKPTPDDYVRQLTKAGALIAAEIDRLQA